MSKEQQTKPNLEQFPATQLPVFSPYKIRKWEVVEKQVTIQQGDRKGQSFKSKSYVLEIIPQQNPDIALEVTVFEKDFMNMKAIAVMNGGFSQVWIKAIKDDSKKISTNIYSGFKG